MKALNLANFIVSWCKEKGKPISNLQLQKFLYFIQLKSIQISGGKSAFIDPARFEAWRFGPVISEVYYAFCLNGGSPIIETSAEAEVPLKENIPNYVIDVINKALDMDPWQLVSISHREGGAWKSFYKDGYKKIMDNEAIKKYALSISI